MSKHISMYNVVSRNEMTLLGTYSDLTVAEFIATKTNGIIKKVADGMGTNSSALTDILRTRKVLAFITQMREKNSKNKKK